MMLLFSDLGADKLANSKPRKSKKKNLFVTHYTKRNLMGTAKSINPGKPAESAQADHGQNCLLLADFLCINPLPDDKF